MVVMSFVVFVPLRCKVSKSIKAKNLSFKLPTGAQTLYDSFMSFILPTMTPKEIPEVWHFHWGVSSLPSLAVNVS